MEAITKVKNTLENVAGIDAKASDLKKDTVDVSSFKALTTDQGVKVSDNDNWLAVATNGRIGPLLLEDQIGREKIHRFDHERIPERAVHARGAGAFGTFRLLESAADVTCAKVLTDTSRTTPVFVRFSTVLGSRGSADTVRDVRGFAVKFYTEEGNWDIVGNNIPVFFVQDAFKFTDLVHAAKPEPQNEVPQAQTAHNNLWDFVFLHSEATHMMMWAMSDRTIPRSYRMMQGFGVNTFCLINEQGVRSFVKYHWTPTLGVNSLVWDEALKLSGQDPDFHRKDLWEAIENGAYPKWKFGIQVLSEDRQDEFDFDILDATKLWPEELVPIRYIGELELNRNPDEYFTQTEQVAFATSNIVPGMDFSDDPLLLGRNFSYHDTQLSRLGVNWAELPINRPVCPFMNNNRDGAMRHRITKGSVNYWPNRFEAVPPVPYPEGFASYPEKVVGLKARMKSEKFKDHFSQAQLFYNSMTPYEQLHMQKSFAFELSHCEDPIVYNRWVQRLAQVDEQLCKAVAAMVATEEPTEFGTNAGKTTRLSQSTYPSSGITGRRVAILIADGFDATAYGAIKAAITAAGGVAWTIGPRRTPIKSTINVTPEHHFEGQRSTMFDALFICPGEKSVAALSQQGRVIHWIREAFGHLKTIGAVGDAVSLVDKAISLPEVVLASTGVKESYGVVTADGLGDTSLKDASSFVSTFFDSISKHRNYDRELTGLADKIAY